MSSCMRGQTQDKRTKNSGTPERNFQIVHILDFYLACINSVLKHLGGIFLIDFASVDLLSYQQVKTT